MLQTVINSGDSICHICPAQQFACKIRGRVNKLPAYPISDGPRRSRFSCLVPIRIRGYKIARLSSHYLIRYWMSNIASDAKTWFSSKAEYRAVIRNWYLKGKTGKEIHGELAFVYGYSSPSYAQVKFWVGAFNCGWTSLEEARFGRVLDATNKEMCKKVRDLVLWQANSGERNSTGIRHFTW